MTVNNINQYGNINRNNRRRCWFHNVDDHDILHCNAFRDLEVPARMNAVRKQSACFCCLKIGRMANRCFFKTMCTEKDQINRVCGRTHHKLLHNDLSRTETIQDMAENKE